MPPESSSSESWSSSPGRHAERRTPDGSFLQRAGPSPGGRGLPKENYSFASSPSFSPSPPPFLFPSLSLSLTLFISVSISISLPISLPTPLYYPHLFLCLPPSLSRRTPKCGLPLNGEDPPPIMPPPLSVRAGVEWFIVISQVLKPDSEECLPKTHNTNPPRYTRFIRPWGLNLGCLRLEPNSIIRSLFLSRSLALSLSRSLPSLLSRPLSLPLSLSIFFIFLSLPLSLFLSLFLFFFFFFSPCFQ